MLVTGKATYLKSESGTSNRNGETRVWHRAAFLDNELNPVSFYFENANLLSGIDQTSEVELTLSVNQGRNGFYVNIEDVRAI